MLSPGVRRVMEMAKVDCSALRGSDPVESFGGGTGTNMFTRDSRLCRWIAYSGKGPSGV